LAEVKWIKITTNMFEDEKIDFIESLPEADAILVIWIKLLTLAGRCNAGGFIFLTEKIPYTPEMLSHTFRRPLNTIKLALKTLSELDMIEFDDNNFLKISNWEKHQNIEGLEKIREQNRLRKRRQREREKALKEGSHENSHVTSRDSHATDIEEDRELDIEEEKEIEDKEPPVPYEEIKELYNSTCKSLSKVRSVSSTRKRHLKARWQQLDFNIDTFQEAFEKVEASDFCTGKNDRGWKADFDWLIKNDNNIVKVLEGAYDNRTPLHNGHNNVVDYYEAAGESPYGW
jgi:predicted phage replisome organizer